MDDITSLLGIISKVGFPIVSCAAAGYFVFLTIKFILNTILLAIEECNTIIEKLDRRVGYMTNDMIRLHQKVNVILELKEKNEFNNQSDKE
jgi:hypothetical protein